MKHTIKILRNCFSKKSQHNPGCTLVSSAPNLWAVDLWKVVRVYARGCRRAAIFKPSSHQAPTKPPSSHQAIKPSSHLHVDTFTYVCQCGGIGILHSFPTRRCSDLRARGL